MTYSVKQILGVILGTQHQQLFSWEHLEPLRQVHVVHTNPQANLQMEHLATSTSGRQAGRPLPATRTCNVNSHGNRYTRKSPTRNKRVNSQGDKYARSANTPATTTPASGTSCNDSSYDDRYTWSTPNRSRTCKWNILQC